MYKPYPMIQTLLNCLSNNGCVFIEGRSFGQLVDGASWPAIGVSGNRFCNSFRFRDGAIKPGLRPSTAEFFPWTPVKK
jgi:hypothetical protein